MAREKVECDVENCKVDFKGQAVDGVCVTCSLCEHAEEAGGTGEASIKRCLAQMRENCPEGQENYYTVD